MNSEEKRQAVLRRYEEMLGRNLYSQNLIKRECALVPYRDGHYYSDCSSSIRIAYREAGVGLPNIGGNTAGIHASGRKVNVTIEKGMIRNPELLRPGDCLMFRGSDPRRPLQIGHVELVASEDRIYGHGSRRPSAKNLEAYLAGRERMKAANGLSRGLVEVRRFIEDDADIRKLIPVSSGKEGLEVLCDLNIRTGPGGPVSGIYRTGERIFPLCRTDEQKNSRIQTDRGWISARYVRGWLLESGSWWYLQKGYTYPAATVLSIGSGEYAFDREGFLLTADRIAADGSLIPRNRDL